MTGVMLENCLLDPYLPAELHRISEKNIAGGVLVGTLRALGSQKTPPKVSIFHTTIKYPKHL